MVARDKAFPRSSDDDEIFQTLSKSQAFQFKPAAAVALKLRFLDHSLLTFSFYGKFYVPFCDINRGVRGQGYLIEKRSQ